MHDNNHNNQNIEKNNETYSQQVQKNQINKARKHSLRNKTALGCVVFHGEEYVFTAHKNHEKNLA